MATANASLPAYNNTYVNPDHVPNQPILSACQVIVSSDIYNPILEEDYFIQIDAAAPPDPSQTVYLIAARYRFLTMRCEAGWSRYTFFATLLGLPPGTSHEDIEAGVFAALGQTVDEAWPVYGPFYIPAGIDEGDAAQVYDQSPTSDIAVTGLDTLTCYAQFTAAVDPIDGWGGQLFYMNTGGGYPSTFGFTGVVNGGNLILVDQDTVTVNGTPTAIPPADVAYNVVFEVHRALGNSVEVTNGTVHIEYPAQDMQWTYTNFFADGAPVDPVALNVVGNRYGLANLNHGFGIAPRKVRG